MQATGYTIVIAPLYSIIINCCFIVEFIILANYYPKSALFRFQYHHHFIVLLPILMQNEQIDVACWINRLIIIILSILFLAYTQIMKDIQISPHLRTLKFSIMLIAFSIRSFTYSGSIALIIIYDLIVICQTFVMVIPHNQNLLKFQILTCFSVVRFTTIITLFYSNYWLILFLFPLILGLSIQVFNKFLQHQITLAIASCPYTLRDIILIYYTYQLGLQPGLFYLSQILVTHSKDCSRPHCFCTEKFELRLEETWKTPESGLMISVNQVMCDIVRLYKFKENNSEYLLLLTRIETEFRNDRLFETLIRSKKLQTSKCCGKLIFPYQFRIESHRLLFYQKLQEKIVGVKINSLIYFNYCNLVEQLGQQIVHLTEQRKEIFTMLTLQYQYPLYYLYHSKLSEYMLKVTLCEGLLKKIVELNSQSIVTQHLTYALYTFVTCQPDKKKRMKNQKNSIDPLWNVLNDRQCCFVQCKYNKGLIMIGHSVLFTTIIEESGIQSEFIGQYIDKLIAGPAQEIHSQFLNRLIEEGKPRLLNVGIQQFFITTKQGYMKQIDSLVRLGQSMEHLTFMTIMGFKQEDSCGKILLSSEGKMYSYCRIAADMLNLNLILKRADAKHLDINLKLSVAKITYDEVQTGFILLPKISLATHDRPQQFLTAKSISQISYYKYFLQHPKQCLVTISSYRFVKSSYDQEKCQFEILYLYQSHLLKDIEHKMMALEIMLKQAMIVNNINGDSYITSYTSFKSIITQNQKNNANSSNESFKKSLVEQQDLDDRNFIMSDESIHIQQDPKAIQFTPFSQENQNDNVNLDDQKEFNNQINHSSIISNSFATQDQFLNSRRAQEESTMRARENQQGIKQNFNNLEIQIHQQKLQGDLEEIQSPEELQQVKEMQISHNEMAEKYIIEQIEWIKSQVKYQKSQSERQKTYQKQYEEKDVDIKQNLEKKQPSSLCSSDSQQGLITHILHGMMQSNQNQFNNLKIVALLYIVSLIIVIILSGQQWKSGLEQYFLESRGGQFSLSLLQNLNLMEIALHLLSHQNNFKALQFYVSKSTQDYIDYCQAVNYMQNTNYDFLKNLETQYIPIRRSFLNSSQAISSNKLQARHFLVDQFAEIFVANNETVQYGNSKFNILGLQESYFTLNYPIFFNLSLSLIDDVDQKMESYSENFKMNSLIYILSGISICILTVSGLAISEISILQWRKKIIRTCFLFQNLMKSIVDSDYDINRLLEVDELKHLRQPNQKSEKQNNSLAIKQEQRFQNYLLKKQFWLKQLIYMMCLIGLELIYFVPYFILANNDISQLEKFHQQVNQLGLASLAFSNRLVFFVQQYANPDNNIDESSFIQYDEFFSNQEDEFLYELPYSQSSSALQLTDLVNGNICELSLSQQLNKYGYECPYNLQQGYQKFVVSTSNQLQQFRSQYPEYILGINQILNDIQFQNILISYGYIFPIFMRNSDDLYSNQEEENKNYYRSSILLTASGLVAIAIIYGILILFIIKQFKWIIMTVKLSLYIFSKEQIAGNKHLVQILSKTVTVV